MSAEVLPYRMNAGENDVVASEHDGRFASLTLTLARATDREVLALGAESKSSVCFYSGHSVVLLGGVGRLDEPMTFRAFQQALNRLLDAYGVQPAVVVHDLHPGYQSTRLARTLGRPLIGVQHHHAHAVAVMAEHGINEPVLALCCDGAGYGTDGATWGCELLRCRLDGFVRLGHHAYFALPGGDAAAIQTWRPALALLLEAYGDDWRRHAVGELARVPLAELELLAAHCNRTPVKMRTSSLGRIFDGVSALLGLCARNDREAQAAIALEQAAMRCTGEPYPYETTTQAEGLRMSLSPAIRAIVADIQAGRAASEIAGRFHETVARMLATSAEIAADQTGLRTVVLAGGCFVNELLRERVIARLLERKIEVFVPRQTSYGDDSIALGQAVIGAALIERSQSCDGPSSSSKGGE